MLTFLFALLLVVQVQSSTEHTLTATQYSDSTCTVQISMATTDYFLDECNVNPSNNSNNFVSMHCIDSLLTKNWYADSSCSVEIFSVQYNSVCENLGSHHEMVVDTTGACAQPAFDGYAPIGTVYCSGDDQDEIIEDLGQISEAECISRCSSIDDCGAIQMDCGTDCWILPACNSPKESGCGSRSWIKLDACSTTAPKLISKLQHLMNYLAKTPKSKNWDKDRFENLLGRIAYGYGGQQDTIREEGKKWFHYAFITNDAAYSLEKWNQLKTDVDTYIGDNLSDCIQPDQE